MLINIVIIMIRQFRLLSEVVVVAIVGGAIDRRKLRRFAPPDGDDESF